MSGRDITVTMRHDGREIDVTDALDGKPNKAFEDMVGDVLTSVGIKHAQGGTRMAQHQPRLVDAPVELKPPSKTIAKGLGSGSTGLAGVDEFGDLIGDWIEYLTMAGATEEEIEKLSSFVEALRFHAAGLHRVFAEIHEREADLSQGERREEH